jgi:hypothetical protein
MSEDFHGADRVADFLDKPLPEGGTHRKRVATMARAYLSCRDIAPLVAESGLDVDDIVADLTSWRD